VGDARSYLEAAERLRRQAAELRARVTAEVQVLRPLSMSPVTAPERRRKRGVVIDVGGVPYLFAKLRSPTAAQLHTWGQLWTTAEALEQEAAQLDAARLSRDPPATGTEVAL
jgi:anti-sigma factor RsiW